MKGYGKPVQLSYLLLTFVKENPDWKTNLEKVVRWIRDDIIIATSKQL